MSLLQWDTGRDRTKISVELTAGVGDGVEVRLWNERTGAYTVLGLSRGDARQVRALLNQEHVVRFLEAAE